MITRDAIDELAGFAAMWTGFSREAILEDAVRRVLGTVDPEQVVRRARMHDPDLVHLLCQAVSVGETFLFRHPEHFRHLASRFLPRRIEQGRVGVRAWSAGCASGEEAYSIAACLLDVAPWPRGSIEVLGTDLIERNLALARAASYGAWSRREAGPMLHPVGREDGARLRIDERVREAARFSLHNLLHAPPQEAPFDVIFCRNVLVYFSPDAARTVVANLVSALAPDGVICFGPMDLAAPPPGLVPASKPEEQIWCRPQPRPEKKAAHTPRSVTPASVPPVAPPVPREVPPPEPVALHLRALRHIEHGERQVADRALAELCRLVPDYVPGLVERALFKMRQGEHTLAAALMREVLRRTEKLPGDELLPGPEPLPVHFYRESAGNFLRGAQR